MTDGTELEILKALEGGAYRRRRDQLVASGVDLASVAEQAQRQPDRRIEVVATIAASWARHRGQYEAVLARLDGIDVASASATMTGAVGAARLVLGVEVEQQGEALLPFFWEQVIKFRVETPWWKTLAFFDGIAAIPSEASIEPMLWALEVYTTAEQINVVHKTLLRLPYAGHADRLAEVREQHQLRRFVADDLLVRLPPKPKKGGPKP